MMLSKKDMANLLNISEQAYGRYESGERDISFVSDNLIHLGINYIWIVTGKGPMFLKEKICLDKEKNISMVVSDIDPRSIYQTKSEYIRKINEILNEHPELEEHVYHYLKSILTNPGKQLY